MFDELKDVKEVIAEFKEIKALFDALAKIPLTIDGHQLTALQEAQDLVRLAAEHHVTIEEAIKELLDPATAGAEIQRLLKQAADHGTELGKFIDGIKAIVGPEFAVVKEHLEAHAAKKAAKK